MHPALKNPGGIRDTEDTRDHLWQEVGFGSAPFDWNKGYDVEEELRIALNDPTFKIPVKDQGSAGSCGGQAWSYDSAVIEALNTKSFEERSAKFVYSQTFVKGGGSAGRDNSEILINQGDCKESVLTSYINGQPATEAFMQRRQDITPEAIADAKLNRELSYANVNADIDSFAQAMRDNGGIIMGIDGEDNGTWLSEFPKPPSKAVWGHWLYLGKAKLVDGVKTVYALNSWGPSVGVGGWQGFQKNYFDSGHIWYGWTHIYNSTPPAAGFHYVFKHQMDFGAIGADVVALQTALQLEGCFPLTTPCTGLFGTLTKASVMKFQKKYGIEQVGRVGPATLAKLNAIYGV